MIPIKQSRFGYPDGNCFAACVASLLEMDLEKMPVIPGPHDPTIWNNIWNQWFEARGIGRVCFAADGVFYPDGWYIASGRSPREIYDELGRRVYHSVVAFKQELRHDPHPDNTFLEGGISEIDILYPLDPGVLRLGAAAGRILMTVA